MIFDTLDLQGVEVFSSKAEKTAGYKVFKIDSSQISTYESGDLAELISFNTTIFVKSYGQGSLATSSIRGASATHTQVIWNGVNINSPMPGQADFSQVPVFFADKAKIYYGPGSMFQTSGGLGGSIVLGTGINWQNRLNVQLSQRFASFETLNSSARVDVGNAKFQSSTRLFYTQSENNYSYSDIAASRENPPEEARTNAAYRQSGLLQELAWKAGVKTILWAKIWLQNNLREIPPNMLVNVPEGNEKSKERLARGIVGMDHFFPKASLKVQTGMLYSFLNYQNEISQIDDDNTVTSSVSSVNYNFHGIENLVLSANFAYDHHRAQSDNYSGIKYRNEAALSAGANYVLNNRVFFNLLIRQELIDGNPAPFTPSFGMSFNPIVACGFLLKANVARNFKAPSLNDLYWSPGGNPDLQNETGFSYEAGLMYSKVFSLVDFSAEATWFHNDIDNWIMWQPDSVFSYWTPSNLKNVLSKGLELSISVNGDIGKLEWNYSLQYAYTSAQNVEAVSDNDESVGEQLIYVPENAVNQIVRLEMWGAKINYVLNYTGIRYTASDNSRYLPAFTTQDILLSKSLSVKKNIFNLQFAVNNFMDTQYQVIAWQPMPGRNYSISIKYVFNK